MALAPERDAESSYGLLRVYSYYRATLSLLLILMYFLLRRSESAPVLQHELYLYTAIPYAVLAISQDLDELLERSDRLCVMFMGRLSAPMPTALATLEALGLLMGGEGLAARCA